MVDIPNYLMGVINQQTSLWAHHLVVKQIGVPGTVQGYMRRLPLREGVSVSSEKGRGKLQTVSSGPKSHALSLSQS